MRSNSKHTTEELERCILIYFDEGISFSEVKEECDLLINWTAFGIKR